MEFGTVDEQEEYTKSLFARLWEYGVVYVSGDMDNFSDCEVDKILVHIATLTTKRFGGTFWDTNFEPSMMKWAMQFGKQDHNKLTATQVWQVFSQYWQTNEYRKMMWGTDGGNK